MADGDMTVGDMTVGFLHPGQMGGSLAHQCRSASKVWVGEGRSADTAARAHDSGLVELPSLADMVDCADVIVSICPPAAAVDVAERVAAADFAGVYVDANAVAPATAEQIARLFERFVDGGVVGPPARSPGTTRLYLSGPDAALVASLWDGTWVDARCIGDIPGSASALKMAYAAWTKGSSALLIACRELAREHDVDGALVDEWETSIPGLVERYDRTVAGTRPKAWRFVGEMYEIAASMAAVDLPDGFHQAAAEIYGRLAADNGQKPDLP